MPSLPKGGARPYFPQLSLLGLAAAALQTYLMWGSKGTDFARMIYVDNYTFFFYFIFILGTALTVMISRKYLEDYGKNLGEYYALLLFATVGMMLMAASAHLIMLFLGLEVMSIAVYVLAGLFREDAALQRSLPEISDPGLLLQRLSALRHGHAVRRRRRHPLPGRAAQGPGRAYLRPAPDPAGHWPADRGLRLQGGLGALPHVDPGRL